MLRQYCGRVSFGRAARSRSIRFLVLRRLARSGAATIRMSSARDQGAPRPAGPHMRHVEHDARHGRAQHVEDRVERLGAEVVDLVERRGRGEQAQMVGALRQQPVDEGRVDAVRRHHGVGDALRRVLVEVEAGGAERQVEIGDHRVEMHVARDRPGDVVRDRRGADAALGADHRERAADRLGVGRVEQAGDRADEVERADRRDQVVADAAPHHLAIEHDVVEMADHDHARAGVADLGERIEPVEQLLAAAVRLDDDDVRRRRTRDRPRSRPRCRPSGPSDAPWSCGGLRRRPAWRRRSRPRSQNAWIEMRGTGAMCSSCAACSADAALGSPPLSANLIIGLGR